MWSTWSGKWDDHWVSDDFSTGRWVKGDPWTLIIITVRGDEVTAESTWHDSKYLLHGKLAGNEVTFPVAHGTTTVLTIRSPTEIICVHYSSDGRKADALGTLTLRQAAADPKN